MLLRKIQLVGRNKIIGLKKFNPYKHGIFAIDTEGTGLDAWGELGVDRPYAPARPFMVSLCDGDGNMALITWKVNPFTREVVPTKKGMKILRNLLSDKKLAKVFHNFSYDSKVLRLLGLKIKGRIEDTMLRQYCIRTDEFSFGLKPLCQKYLQIDDKDQKALHTSVIAGRRIAKKNGWMLAPKPAADYHLGDWKLCAKYAKLDAFRTMSLYALQEMRFEKLKHEKEIYDTVERPTMLVLDRMERRGTAVDKERVKEVKEFYRKYVEDAGRVIKKIAGDLNPRSPKQMTKMFFGKLGHTPLRYSRKGKSKVYVDCQHCKGDGCKICQMTGRNPKCDGEFLESIGVDKSHGDKRKKDPLAYNLLLNNASTTMLQFVDSYLELMVREDDQWIIHPNYRQCKVRTTRLSAEKPNLQNVASDDSGKKKVDLPYRPRECFIPRKGCILYVPDYSQIEVWLVYLRSKDAALGKILLSGGDTHGKVAATVIPGAFDLDHALADAKKDPTTLSASRMKNLKTYKSMRKKAKNTQFCKIYGGGPEKIAWTAGCTLEEATEFVERYDSTFVDVKSFMDRNIDFARKHGYIKNAYGIKIYTERGLEYRATNYDIQGSAATLMKRAMLNTDTLCRTPEYKGKLFLQLQIHDELLIEGLESTYSNKTMRDIAECMSRDYKLLGSPIPFPIGMKIARERWSESSEVMI